MSRIGKQVINIPNNISVSFEGSKIIFKGTKETKELDTFNRVVATLDNNILSFAINDESMRAFWGTYRALANNIVVGMSSGFTKQLEINGVGYRAVAKDKTLELILGFSHPINFDIPSGINISVDKNIITIKGNDKQRIGQVAAKIRSFRPPEPYKGKGIKYTDEIILRKSGKTSKK